VYNLRPGRHQLCRLNPHVATSKFLSCIENMNGRFFDGRKLEADFYDGKSDYRVQESEEERQKRLAEWDKWIEDGEDEN